MDTAGVVRRWVIIWEIYHNREKKKKIQTKGKRLLGGGRNDKGKKEKIGTPCLLDLSGTWPVKVKGGHCHLFRLFIYFSVFQDASPCQGRQAMIHPVSTTATHCGLKRANKEKPGIAHGQPPAQNSPLPPCPRPTGHRGPITQDIFMPLRRGIRIRWVTFPEARFWCCRVAVVGSRRRRRGVPLAPGEPVRSRRGAGACCGFGLLGGRWDRARTAGGWHRCRNGRPYRAYF